MMTRRDLMRFAGVTPLAALSDWQPIPVHQQFLPLAQLPQPSPPTGLGLGAPWQSGDNVPAMLERLRPAWWYDWRFEQAGSEHYVPMIWSGAFWSEHATAIQSIFARRPDAFWLLWNEPEREDQANMSAAGTAVLTRQIANYGIQYAAPGVSLTDSGYRWLEDYIRHDGPIPHCWHVHIYECTNPGQVEVAWTRWTQWMDRHNCARPTIISEINAWTEGDFGQRAMLEFLAVLLAEEPLLQAVAWFATRWPEWGAGTPDLLRDDGSLTPRGDVFRQLREQS